MEKEKEEDLLPWLEKLFNKWPGVMELDNNITCVGQTKSVEKLKCYRGIIQSMTDGTW